ncbi:hypothetical protein HDU77_005626 [Chytriomyces hyalinus]|nr:hypothetical protein HDU77_005626 [Chytriomyces hyalinus]
MNPEKLAKLQAASAAARIGGKGTPRRKVNKVVKTSGSDDKKLQATLKKLNTQSILGIEEVNMFKQDGSVLHFPTAKVQAATLNNTIIITGTGQKKDLTELVPGILTQMGAESLAQLRRLAEAYQQAAAAGAGPSASASADDEDVPELVPIRMLSQSATRRISITAAPRPQYLRIQPLSTHHHQTRAQTTAAIPTPENLWATPKWNPKSVRPYKDKSTAELLNSYTVFKLCEFPPLVSMTPTIIDIAEKTGTKFIMNYGVKKTFFKHFCGGETISEVLPTMTNFKRRNMGAILDLAMEADMEADTEPTLAKAKETSSHILNLMKESVDIAGETPGSFIAAKVTAYVPPGVLLRWTNTLRLVQERFDAVKHSDGTTTVPELLKSLQTVFPQLTASQLDKLNNVSKLDWIAVSDHFTFANKGIRSGLLTTLPASVHQLMHPIQSANDFETLDAVVEDLHLLMKHAADKQVKVMVDAEQTYFQRAIDDVALELCRRFNVNGNVVVFNTYQMYLKDGLHRLQIDLDRANRAGWTFGVKIVRGAYMVSERERATEMNYPDPINPTITDTHATYNAAIDHLLANLSKNLEFVVASHNKSSVAKTVAAMEKHGVSPSNKQISFAQLMGMQDGTSFALAENGYRCFKYVPYGPIDVTIPYLLRRAQENSSVLGGVGEDKQELVAELGRRMRSEV